MKLRFKHQKFQADAAKAVVDVFAGWLGASISPESSVKAIWGGSKS